jgi:heme exporter protein A
VILQKITSMTQPEDTLADGAKPLNLRDSQQHCDPWGAMSRRNIQAERLQLWRGEHRVLAGIDLVVGAGEMLQVTGANGSGKTSLLRTLSGLMHLEDGRVLWAGRDIYEDLPAFHAQMVYLGHEPPLKADLTARENLQYWVGIRRPLSTADITAALERVGARAWGEQAVRTLSAGQKRRVGLAGVILCAAPLWLLDEPATNLDGDGQRLVGSLIDEQLASGGVVIAAVHQDLPVGGAEPRRLELSAA